LLFTVADVVLQHIWRPWDENNPVGDWPGTYLTSRIRLHFDLVNKSGKKIRLNPDTSSFTTDTNSTRTADPVPDPGSLIRKEEGNSDQTKKEK
jgi:hypothetical protein